jgi:hypothetical protein
VNAVCEWWERTFLYSRLIQIRLRKKRRKKPMKGELEVAMRNNRRERVALLWSMAFYAPKDTFLKA